MLKQTLKENCKNNYAVIQIVFIYHRKSVLHTYWPVAFYDISSTTLFEKWLFSINFHDSMKLAAVLINFVGTLSGPIAFWRFIT